MDYDETLLWENLLLEFGLRHVFDIIELHDAEKNRDNALEGNGLGLPQTRVSSISPFKLSSAISVVGKTKDSTLKSGRSIPTITPSSSSLKPSVGSLLGKSQLQEGPLDSGPSEQEEPQTSEDTEDNRTSGVTDDDAGAESDEPDVPRQHSRHSSLFSPGSLLTSSPQPTPSYALKQVSKSLTRESLLTRRNKLTSDKLLSIIKQHQGMDGVLS